MRVAVDTNRLTDLFRGDVELAERLEMCDEVWIPLVVLGELMAGLYGGTHQHRNEILLRRLLAKDTVEVLTPGRETAEQLEPPSPITICGSPRSFWNTTCF